MDTKNKVLIGLVIAIVIGAAIFMVGYSNPKVNKGEVAYVANMPFVFGNKGEFLDILIGPESYGVGWANDITASASYQPITIPEHFSKISDTDDRRILSSDKINMEIHTSVIIGMKNSPASDDFNAEKFKKQARNAFENYGSSMSTSWRQRYSEKFRAKVRILFGELDYDKAKGKRTEYATTLTTWCNDVMMKNSPFCIIAVTVSNVNPPKRMIDQQEELKAVKIKSKIAAAEKQYADDMKAAIDSQANNLNSALSKNPKYLDWYKLQTDRKMAENLGMLLTDENAAKNQRVIIMPYGSPISVNASGQ